ARASAEPERRDAPLATDGELLGGDAEKARERRDGELADRLAPRRLLRKPRDSAVHGGRRITRPARHRVEVLHTHADVDEKPAVAEAHGQPLVGVPFGVEARRREDRPRILLPRGLVGALLRGPQEPADALRLPARLDQRAFCFVEDTAVEARVTTLGAAFRIAEVDDVIADHRNASARAARACA